MRAPLVKGPTHLVLHPSSSSWPLMTTLPTAESLQKELLHLTLSCSTIKTDHHPYHHGTGSFGDKYWEPAEHKNAQIKTSRTALLIIETQFQKYFHIQNIPPKPGRKSPQKPLLSTFGL